MSGSRKSRSIKLVMSAVVSSVLVSSVASAKPVRCVDVVSRETEHWERIAEEIRPTDPAVDFSDVRSFLSEWKRASESGLVRSRFSDDFKTRFYYAASAKPGADGRIPMVSRDTKGIYIFFHGSGTMKSSGRNFRDLMNTLGSMGYSAFSFDMPFHMEGPSSSNFNRADHFMGWLRKIVLQAKADGGNQPIYFVGHSFGPDVMAEYVFRYPNDIDGAAMLSPAGFDKVLEKWYRTKTEKMKFGGEVPQNTMAGTWADTMSKQFGWNKTNGKFDPTVLNPNLQIRMLSGNLEEYVPAPLGPNGLPSGPNTYDIGKAYRKHMKNAVVTIEPGIGHYLFEHEDSQKQNAALREVLALSGVSPKNVGAIIQEQARRVDVASTLTDRVFRNFAVDRLFHSWVLQTYGERAFQTAVRIGDDNFMKGVETRYSAAQARRWDEARELVLQTAERDPAFAEENRAAIESMKKSKDNAIFRKFVEYLEKNPQAGQ